jgi:hypothetical protein
VRSGKIVYIKKARNWLWERGKSNLLAYFGKRNGPIDIGRIFEKHSWKFF